MLNIKIAVPNPKGMCSWRCLALRLCSRHVFSSCRLKCILAICYKASVLGSVQQSDSNRTSCSYLFATASQLLRFPLLASPSALGTCVVAQRTLPKSDRSRPRQVCAASAGTGVMLRPVYRCRPPPSTNVVANPPAPQALYRLFVQFGKLCAILAVSAQAVRGTPPLLDRIRTCSSPTSMKTAVTIQVCQVVRGQMFSVEVEGEAPTASHSLAPSPVQPHVCFALSTLHILMYLLRFVGCRLDFPSSRRV
eukprot:COSAG02_NODE_8779_length_2449_cov_1.989787_2_plen_250_part_00